jgi:hypothetical protein
MIAKIVILVVASFILAATGSPVEPDNLNKVDMKNGIYDAVVEKDSYIESQDLTVTSSLSSTARFGHSLLGMDDGIRSLQQFKIYSSCGALGDPTDNWVNGTCVALETSVCCEFRGKIYSSCDALTEPKDNWVDGICYGLEASDCCKLSPGGIVLYVVIFLAIVLGIVACSCACCCCCPLHSKMCCARKDQQTNTPVVAGTSAGNAYDGVHTETMNAREDTPP